MHKKFEEELATQLFFTDLNTTATCQICGQKVLYREFNMKRHYAAKHAGQQPECGTKKEKAESGQLHADLDRQQTSADPDLRGELPPGQKAPGIVEV